MKTRSKSPAVFIAFLTLIIAAGMFPSFGFIGGTGASTAVAFAADTATPTFGEFANDKGNSPKNIYTITKDSKEQTVISYKGTMLWNAADVTVSGYTSAYTRLCVTATFVDTAKFGVEVVMPSGTKKVIRSGSDAPSKSSTRNADGSYTFDIQVPSDVRTKGIATLMFYLDPSTTVSKVRYMTILDIGFRKDGEPAYGGTKPTPIPVYSVSLDKTGTHTFPATIEGYSAQDPVTITIMNTGNTPTGNLNLALSGTNAGSFTLVPATTVATIAVSGKGTFTVVPKMGLAPGTYTATVKVSNTNVKEQSFAVSFTVTQKQNDYYYVAKNGSDATGFGDGSAAKPWATIKKGISMMKPGYTLIINEGVYNEKVTIDKSGEAGKYITIKGAEGKDVVLDGTGISGSNMIYLNDRSYIRIENLEIRNSMSKSDTNTGINIQATKGSTGIQIVNNRIWNISCELSNDKNAHGIVVYGHGTTESSAIKGLLIQGNEVYKCKLGSSEAIALDGNVVDWEIIGNYVHNNDNIGIDASGGYKVSSVAKFDRARDGLISGNVVVNNIGPKGNDGVDGIYVDGGRDIKIVDNYVSGSAYGIEIGNEEKSWGGVDFKPTGITVRNNVSQLNTLAGILIGGSIGSLDAIVEKNTVYQVKGYGIEVRTNSKSHTLKDNIVMTADDVEYVHMEGKAAPPVYSNNIYYSVNASKPTGDAYGTVVTKIPVANLTNGIITPTVSAGATLPLTPFLKTALSK